MQVSYALGVGMEGEDPTKDTPEARATLLKEASEAASKADVAVVVVGRYPKLEGEGFDVKTMDLPAGQDDLIEAVEKANPHTIVVLNTGDPVTMTRWIDHTPALLDMWYGGQEAGHALAAILFGDANPSGKLPVSLPKRFEDSPAYGHYPGENLFEYSDLRISPAKGSNGLWSVNAKIRNTGSRPGAEVAELFVHDGHSKIDRPVHELKGFQRVELKPGESKTVQFTLDRAALSYWSPATKAWTADPGDFEVQLGASSRDIRLRAPLTLGQ